jgi:hypothetical protein
MFLYEIAALVCDKDPSPDDFSIQDEAVEPLGESWSDWKIICELGRAMGYGEYFPWKSEKEAIDHVLTSLGITCEGLMGQPEGIIMRVPPFLYTKITGVLGTIMRKLLKVAVFRDYPENLQSKSFARDMPFL